jgi:hypothetical protein
VAYARTKETLTPGIIVGGQNVLGKAFYGLRLDSNTGTLTVNKVVDGTSVYIPAADLVNSSADYDQWVWTQNKLVFSFDANGHLLMEVR